MLVGAISQSTCSSREKPGLQTCCFAAILAETDIFSFVRLSTVGSCGAIRGVALLSLGLLELRDGCAVSLGVVVVWVGLWL